jgi:hypothetical protein
MTDDCQHTNMCLGLPVVRSAAAMVGAVLSVIADKPDWKDTCKSNAMLSVDDSSPLYLHGHGHDHVAVYIYHRGRDVGDTRFHSLSGMDTLGASLIYYSATGGTGQTCYVLWITSASEWFMFTPGGCLECSGRHVLVPSLSSGSCLGTSTPQTGLTHLFFGIVDDRNKEWLKFIVSSKTLLLWVSSYTSQCSI